MFGSLHGGEGFFWFFIVVGVLCVRGRTYAVLVHLVVEGSTHHSPPLFLHTNTNSRTPRTRPQTHPNTNPNTNTNTTVEPPAGRHLGGPALGRAGRDALRRAGPLPDHEHRAVPGHGAYYNIDANVNTSGLLYAFVWSGLVCAALFLPLPHTHTRLTTPPIPPTPTPPTTI